MENKKDIGAFLKSKLEQAQKVPNESLWEKINASLEKKERRRKRTFWVLFPAIVGLGIFIFLISQQPNNGFLDEKEKISIEEIERGLDGKMVIENTTEKSVSKEKNEMETQTEIEIEIEIEIENNDKITAESKVDYGNKVPSKNVNTKLGNSTKKNNGVEGSAKSEDISVSKTIKTTDGITNQKMETSPERDTENSIAKIDNDSILKVKTDSIALAKINKIEKRKKKQSEKDSTIIQKTENPKWTIMAIGGPVLFEVSEKTSAIDPSLDGAKISRELNFAYGVGIGFNLNEKLSLSYSAIRTKLSYSVNNVRSTSSTDSLRVFSLSALSGNISRETLSSFAGNDAIAVRQEIEYIEMPLQLSYSLTKSRFGAHVFGGFSTFFLTDDRFFAENSNNEKLELGRANNLSKINFGVHAGIGAYYKISKKFIFELNPTIKYHFNLLDNPSRDVRGFLYGINAGLKYNLNTD